MKYTSINHCKNANYQVDYSGPEHEVIASFERWCIDNDVIWAHLFDCAFGEHIISFNNVEGLTASNTGEMV